MQVTQHGLTEKGGGERGGTGKGKGKAKANAYFYLGIRDELSWAAQVKLPGHLVRRCLINVRRDENNFRDKDLKCLSAHANFRRLCYDYQQLK